MQTTGDIQATGDIVAVVFDLGGTLFEFAEPQSLKRLRAGFRLAYDHLVSRRIVVPSFAKYRRRVERNLLVGYLWARLRGREVNTLGRIASVHGAMGIDADQSLVAEIARRYYQPMREITRIEPDHASVLAELRNRRYMLGVISNTIASAPALDDQLEADGLLDLLPVRIYSCEIGVPKPHPRIFKRALKELGVAAGHTAYVGDKPSIDVKGAHRIGMLTVLKTNSGQAPRRGPQPDHVIRNIRDLLDLFPRRSNR